MSDEVKAFRRALGAFATGVTIVTTTDPDGAPVGLTVSSFNSVSLDPPLVLWSLDRGASSIPNFLAATHFAVHVLSQEQAELSNRFAMSGADKYEGVTFDSGLGGVPILRDFAALFECRTVHRYDGGDHVIFVGEVQRYNRRDRAPLVFHGGRYARLVPMD